MARISTYALDANLVGGDKWIGTSANSTIPNATKNFSLTAVAAFLNTTGVVESQALRYTYQNKEAADVRLPETISFDVSKGANVSFSSITTWMISQKALPSKDVSSFYTAPLIGSTILITNAANPSNWAIFLWDSSVVDVLEPLFYNIGLTYVSGAGSLVEDQGYFISLLGYDSSASSGDKNFVFTQAAALSTWVVTHNLGKYCAVSVVDTAGEVVYGNVEYNSINQVTLTFSAAFSGEAFCN